MKRLLILLILAVLPGCAGDGRAWDGFPQSLGRVFGDHYLESPNDHPASGADRL
jgi:hypothetical protein